MPELPEVETVCRGLSAQVLGQSIHKLHIRQYSLRWPIAKSLPKVIKGARISTITRRAKYILIDTSHGTLIIHLGMSGTVTICSPDTPFKKHDHVDIHLDNAIIRYHDPRRFGSIHFTKQDPNKHKLIRHLGLEPLSRECNAKSFYALSIKSHTNIKSFLLDAKKVVGVGNIYASEALYDAQIYPLTPANTLSYDDCKRLVKSIKKILNRAIKQGGTTLKDFSNSEGKPGYFAIKLKVYGREHDPCPNCQHPIEKTIIANRSTFYCPICCEQ